MKPEEFRSYFKPRKYHNSPKQYGGSIYHSTMEANYAAYLDMMKKAVNPSERVVKWDRQVKIDLTAYGVHIANWFCDFRVWFADGRDEYHEVKGRETEAYKLKEKLFRAQYPKAVLLVIKKLP